MALVFSEQDDQAQLPVFDQGDGYYCAAERAEAASNHVMQINFILS